MPLFEYVCVDCGLPFEELVLSSSTTPEVICPACQSKHVTKQISRFASRLTGAATLSFGSSSGDSCSTASV